MNKDAIWEAMAHLEPCLIEEADQQPHQRKTAGRIFLIAAVVCLILAGGVFAANTLFGFQILGFINHGYDNHYLLAATETTVFPIQQFSETVQDYIIYGIPELERQPSEDGSSYTVILDVPTFSTWEEAVAFVGCEIPFIQENTVLSSTEPGEFTIDVFLNQVTIETCFYWGTCRVLFRATAEAEGSPGIETGAAFVSDDVSIVTENYTTGSGCSALIYSTTGEYCSCDTYFIRDGILYNILLPDTSDSSVVKEILDTF